MFVIHRVFFHLLSKPNSELVIIKQTSLTSISISGWTIGGCTKEAWLSASSHSVLLGSAEKQQLRNLKHKKTNLTFVCFIYPKIKESYWITLWHLKHTISSIIRVIVTNVSSKRKTHTYTPKQSFFSSTHW